MAYYTILGKNGTLCRSLLNTEQFEWSFDIESKKRAVKFNRMNDCELYLLSINLIPEHFMFIEHHENDKVEKYSET